MFWTENTKLYQWNYPCHFAFSGPSFNDSNSTACRHLLMLTSTASAQSFGKALKTCKIVVWLIPSLCNTSWHSFSFLFGSRALEKIVEKHRKRRRDEGLACGAGFSLGALTFLLGVRRFDWTDGSMPGISILHRMFYHLLLYPAPNVLLSTTPSIPQCSAPAFPEIYVWL